MTGNGVLLPLLRSASTAARRLSPRWWLDRKASAGSDLYLLASLLISFGIYKYAQPVQPATVPTVLAFLCCFRLAEIFHGAADWLLTEDVAPRDGARRTAVVFLLNIVEVAALTAAASTLLGMPISFADSMRELLTLEPPATFALLTARLLGWARLVIGLLLLLGVVGSIASTSRRD